MALLKTRMYYRHGITQVNMLTQTQVDIVVVWGSRLCFLLFHRLSNQTVKTRIVGKGLKARQLSSGRNCGNANVNQLGIGAKPFGGVRGMTMESSTAVQLIIFHRQNKPFFLHFPRSHRFTLPSQTQRLLDQDTVSLTPLILLVTFS
jgi:hypothetical protein